MPSKPIIVAEIGASHNGSLDTCFELINAAKDAGADYVKLQTYTPETMVADRHYVIPSGPWAGKKLYDLYQEAHTPWEWHEAIFHYCKGIGIGCFSTPFDETAVDFLESLNCPMYKVASFELTDIPLIRYIASKGKPMILSTGMGHVEEIANAVVHAKQAGCKDITILKCTSAYPSTLSDANLSTMVHMRQNFGFPKVGISDHSEGHLIPVIATALGATMIEKHIAIDCENGPDSHFSMLPHEFKTMVEEVTKVYQALGSVTYQPAAAERPSVALRRSLYAVQNINPGDSINPYNVKLRRPCQGIPPDQYDLVLGKKAKWPIKAGTPLNWDLLT